MVAAAACQRATAAAREESGAGGLGRRLGHPLEERLGEERG